MITPRYLAAMIAAYQAKQEASVARLHAVAQDDQEDQSLRAA